MCRQHARRVWPYAWKKSSSLSQKLRPMTCQDPRVRSFSKHRMENGVFVVGKVHGKVDHLPRSWNDAAACYPVRKPPGSWRSTSVPIARSSPVPALDRSEVIRISRNPSAPEVFLPIETVCCGRPNTQKLTPSSLIQLGFQLPHLTELALTLTSEVSKTNTPP